MHELRILSPTAILGYGFPEESFREGMRRDPHVIAVDAGSSDPGPYYLGAGKSFTDRAAVKRDLGFMLAAAIERGIPLIIGTAGGCGANVHLDWNLEIIEELAREFQLEFQLAVIRAEIPKELVLRKMQTGEVHPLAPAPELSETDVHESVRIVAQMGVEPFLDALQKGAQVILAGRAYDPAVFAALAVERGFDRGLAIHLGKILECAAIAATPGSGSDCMFGTLAKDHFRVQPLSPLRKCTTLSVAAHTLYEKSNPMLLPGPGGVLDLSESSFEQESEDCVRVRGSRFVPRENYTVKLEGVKSIGFRTVSIAGVRDPILIERIDSIIEAVREKVRSNFAEHEIGEFFLDFKLYGKNAVMGMFPGLDSPAGSELGIVIEAIGSTQQIANTICGFARSTMLHYGYEGRKSTAGNLAFPFSPSDFPAGEVFVFNIYHLMQLDDPLQCFPVELRRITG